MTRLRTSRIVSLAVLALAAGLPAAAAAPAAAATPAYAVTDLGAFSLGVSDGYGINANGEVTGGSYLSKTYSITCPPNYPNPKKCVKHPENAFLYSNGQMTDLGTLGGGNNSQGNAVNLSGQVAGWSDTSSGNDAVLWSGKKTVDLGALAPLAGSNSIADGINDSGQVAGAYGNSTVHAFLYSNGTVAGLPEPSFTGSLGCEADTINNNGQIAANATDTATGQTHALLLTAS